jgi:hypothetical protein
VAVDLRERQFLAQLVALPAVAGEVDRLRVQERFVEPVELLLDRLDSAFLLRRPLVRFRAPLRPNVEDAIFHQTHVAGRRLQQRQLVDECTFQDGFADIDGAALPLTVVVGVTTVAALRPAARQRTAAGFAAHEAAQREVRAVPLSRAGDNDAAVEHRLRTVERRLIDDRLEVALRRDAVVRTLNLPDVDRVAHQLPETLWRERQALAASQPRRGRSCDHLLLRVSPRRQVLEGSFQQLRAIGIVNEALARPLRSVQVSERRRERPSSEFQCGPHASARSIRAHVVVELRERSQHAFHQLAS